MSLKSSESSFLETYCCQRFTGGSLLFLNSWEPIRFSVWTRLALDMSSRRLKVPLLELPKSPGDAFSLVTIKDLRRFRKKLQKVLSDRIMKILCNKSILNRLSRSNSSIPFYTWLPSVYFFPTFLPSLMIPWKSWVVQKFWCPAESWLVIMNSESKWIRYSYIRNSPTPN